MGVECSASGFRVSEFRVQGSGFRLFVHGLVSLCSLRLVMSAKETREVSVSLLLNEALNRNPNSRDTNLQDLCLSSSSCKVRTAARLCLNMHLGRTSFHMRAGSYRVLANRARLWVSGSVLVSGFRVWHLTFSIHGLGLTPST